MSNTKIYSTLSELKGDISNSVDIGCRVVKWDEANGMSFVRYGKYVKRDISTKDLQSKIKQFCVHWSDTYSAKETYSALISRGLSVNFIIDDDNVNGFATIYQCLPLSYGGWSQGNGFNSIGTGVEASFRPIAKDLCYSEDNQLKHKVPPHKTTIAKIHGTKLNVYLPTEAQINSLSHLMAGFCKLIPIPKKFPKINDEYCYGVIPNALNYSGFVNHYNLSRGKIDSCGLDLLDLENKIKSL